MLQYVAALYDHLLRSKAVNAAEGLPPVLPIVLYNGDIRNLADAIAHSPFKQRIDRVVTRWIKHRLQRKMPGLAVPDAEELTKGMEMLETNIDRRKAQTIANGMQQVKPCCCNDC